MPTYHYRCDDCGQGVEAWQSMTDDPLTTCEACGGALRRVLQPVGIVLKGSGFYRTDSRSGSKKTANGSSKKSDSGSDGSSDSGTKTDTSDAKGSKDSGSGKSDTKPAAAGSGTSTKASDSKST